jgi:hypothetical protein
VADSGDDIAFGSVSPQLRLGFGRASDLYRGPRVALDADQDELASRHGQAYVTPPG